MFPFSLPSSLFLTLFTLLPHMLTFLFMSFSVVRWKEDEIKFLLKMTFLSSLPSLLQYYFLWRDGDVYRLCLISPNDIHVRWIERKWQPKDHITVCVCDVSPHWKCHKKMMMTMIWLPFADSFWRFLPQRWWCASSQHSSFPSLFGSSLSPGNRVVGSFWFHTVIIRFLSSLDFWSSLSSPSNFYFARFLFFHPTLFLPLSLLRPREKDLYFYYITPAAGSSFSTLINAQLVFLGLPSHSLRGREERIHSSLCFSCASSIFLLSLCERHEDRRWVCRERKTNLNESLWNGEKEARNWWGRNYRDERGKRKEWREAGREKEIVQVEPLSRWSWNDWCWMSSHVPS